MSFVPDDFSIPAGVQTEHLRLRMLAPDVTTLDYDALMESRIRLRLWTEGTWPEDDFTLDSNRGDLEEHEREFHAREAFAYTVLNPDESVCEGCVYINQLARIIAGRRFDATAAPFDVDECTAGVSFWVRDSAQARDLDIELLDGLMAWLRRDWSFSAVYFLINSRLPRDEQIYRAAGLAEPVLIPSKDASFSWEFWRLTEAS